MRSHTIQRSALEGWQAVVADLAEKHADELERRVQHLRTLASTLRTEGEGQ